MRRFIMLSAMLLAASLTSGMGGSGSSEDGDLEIPQPELHVQVTVVDKTGTKTRLDDFTWDGFVHVQGNLGAGTVAIPFEKVKRIDFEPGDKGKVTARVGLKTDEVVRLSVSGRLMCYGRTNFGNYQVQIKDLTRLEFPQEPRAAAKTNDE